MWGPPPLVGQHSREVLAEFGFTTAEADALLAHGAVFATRSVNGGAVFATRSVNGGAVFATRSVNG